ncbi:hypothetical protein [Burkholderia glumae]|nr:hypothetical protein [Burkholderia glumae]
MSYEELLETVRDYWSNTTRSQEETKGDLRSLIDEIETLIEALNDD